MTARELSEWAAFERTFGPLTVQERIDAAGALGAWATAAVNGGKADPEDFMPAWDAALQTEPKKQTPEQMIALLRTLPRAQPRKGPNT